MFSRKLSVYSWLSKCEVYEMHIVTVEKFLCCFKLETGGFFLGWLGAILCVLGVVGMLALTILAAVSYEVIEDALNQSYQNGTINNWAADLVMNTSRICSLNQTSFLLKKNHDFIL